jgi:hypothetical protein
LTRRLATAAAARCRRRTPCTTHALRTAAAAVQAIRGMGITHVHYIAGRSSDAAALVAAGAQRARALVYLGPAERPMHMPAAAVSGLYGDPTTTSAPGGRDAAAAAAAADGGSSRCV